MPRSAGVRSAGVCKGGNLLGKRFMLEDDNADVFQCIVLQADLF